MSERVALQRRIPLLFDRLLRVMRVVLRRSLPDAPAVRVDGDLVSDLPTEQFPDRFTVVLPGDVPQRDVDRRRDGVDELPRPPREGVASELPADLLAVERVLADDVVLVRPGRLFEGRGEPLSAEGLSDAGDTFVGFDPYEEPVSPVGVDYERLDICESLEDSICRSVGRVSP